MTEKELRDQVLLAIYNNQDKLNIDNKPFCEREGIVFASNDQRNRVFKALKDSRYITAIAYESGDCLLRGITPRGVDYIEIELPKQQLGQTTPPSIVYNTTITNSPGAATAVGTSGQVTQNTSVNDAKFLELYKNAISEVAESTAISEEDKEELLEALSDYKECVDEQRTPQKS